MPSVYWYVLRVTAVPLGIIVVDTDADLEQVRKHINRLQQVNRAIIKSNFSA